MAMPPLNLNSTDAEKLISGAKVGPVTVGGLNVNTTPKSDWQHAAINGGMLLIVAVITLRVMKK